MYYLEAKGLKKSYEKKQVLYGIDFHVKQGEIVALLGHNGAGKTTSIRIFSTLLSADNGSLEIMGMDTTENKM